MGLENLLYSEIYLICIAICGMLFFWMARRETVSSEELWLKRLFGSFSAAFLFNFLFSLFLSGLAIVRLGLKTVFFMDLVLGCGSYCGYAQSLLKNKAEQKKEMLLPLCLLALALLVPLVNLFMPHLFSVEGAYRRGALFPVFMLLLIAACLVCSLHLIRSPVDPAQRHAFTVAALLPVMLTASLVLSLFLGERVPVICVIVTAELLWIYTGSVSMQISMDKLTQVNNRQNLMGFLNYKIRNHSDSVLLMMLDVDNFKTINDTHGHPEGDAALVTVASVLKQACGPIEPRPYIARYGGDEFIILMEGGEAEKEALCRSIEAGMERASQGRAYRLQVSIGCAQWQDGMNSHELISAADAALYKVKRSRRVGR